MFSQSDDNSNDKVKIIILTIHCNGGESLNCTETNRGDDDDIVERESHQTSVTEAIVQCPLTE